MDISLILALIALVVGVIGIVLYVSGYDLNEKRPRETVRGEEAVQATHEWNEIQFQWYRDLETKSLDEAKRNLDRRCRALERKWFD